MNESDRKALKKYHEQFQFLKLRFLKDSEGIDSEKTIKNKIRKQAEKLNKASINQYILDLIQYDIRNNPEGLLDKDFRIVGTVKI